MPGIAAALAGFALGASVLAGGALLLVAGNGVLGAAGFLLGLALGAAALALWGGAPGSGRSWVAWSGAVVSLVVASVFSSFWGRIAAPGMAGALAALLLLAAPAYTVTSLLAALARRGRGVAVPALAGAAVGTLVAGAWAIPKFDPGALYISLAWLLLVTGWVEARGARAGTVKGKTMNDKVVIVSGVGGRGQMGYALVEAFLDAGARVVATGSSDAVVELAEELSGRGEIVGLAADLLEAAEAERVVATAVERFGGVDVLVNVAGGLTVIRPLAETTPEEWEREVDRNARTAFLLSRAALPHLRERRGAIVNFASPAELRAAAGVGAYSAGKAAVVALTSAMALEEKANGVRVNAVAPGMIDTEQNRAAVEDPDAVRWVTREEVADVVLFLASDASRGITGETIQVLG